MAGIFTARSGKVTLDIEPASAPENMKAGAAWIILKHDDRKPTIMFLSSNEVARLIFALSVEADAAVTS